MFEWPWKGTEAMSKSTTDIAALDDTIVLLDAYDQLDAIRQNLSMVHNNRQEVEKIAGLIAELHRKVM